MRREISVAGTILALFTLLALLVPSYFSRSNLADLLLTNIPVLIVALGMTLVILTGEIDISVGSLFALTSVAAGMAAKWEAPSLFAGLAACLIGAALGALNGTLVTRLRVPSIVATLSAMIAWRDALRWATQGAWIEDLPAGFQWFGLSQSSYLNVILLAAAALTAAAAWGLKNVSGGRHVYATGSNEEGARLAGIRTRLVKFSSFTILGVLTGVAAALNSARFNQIPSNTGLGLEMKVIASVVVGGAAVTGGSGSVLGTVLGVILMGTIGPALTFLGLSAYWDKAIQGGIILAAIVIDALQAHSRIGNNAIRSATVRA
jgi:rhamnose transport system permease protein